MLHIKTKKEALKIHEKAVKKYNETYNVMASNGEKLYNQRKTALHTVELVENLVNSISNTPHSFTVTLEKIRVGRQSFTSTEEFAKESAKTTFKSGAGTAAGITTGATVATLAPSAAMWVATTFGTASTGTAISALSGAAATNAALAWLGGGTLAAGGAGMAGGQALLALAGPVGWSIAGVTAVASGALLGIKNKQLAEQAITQAKQLIQAGANLDQANAKIVHLLKETSALQDKVAHQHDDSRSLKNCDYLLLDDNKKLQLGTLVNNTYSLVQLVNQLIGD